MYFYASLNGGHTSFLDSCISTQATRTSCHSIIRKLSQLATPHALCSVTAVLRCPASGMRSSGSFPTHRSSAGSKDSDLLTRTGYYARSDQPCMLSFRVGDIVWARSNGRWAFGVVVRKHDLLRNQRGTPPIPTYTVLTRGGSSYGLTLVALSPLFGSLKPANTYVAALLRAEGVFPLSGTDHADILDLRIKAHAWIYRRGSQSRMQNVAS